jgi:hypothetical protein
MFIEDLPMWGYIGDASGEDPIMGEVQGSQTYLFPHLHFRLGHNGKKIVSAKVTTDVSKRTRNFEMTFLSRISPSRSYFSVAGS